MSEYHLAQINIARMLAPIEDAIMADFVAQLPPINTLAEESPGFVWRLQSEVVTQPISRSTTMRW